MWFRNRFPVQSQVEQLHSMLKASFSHVKHDTSVLYQWVQHLHIQNQQQQNMIHELRHELQFIPKNPADIKRIVDQYYAFEPMLERMKNIEQRLEDLRIQKMQQPVFQAQPSVIPAVEELKSRLAKLEEKKRSLKEKIIKRVTKNSKEYIKTIIHSYIRKYGKISAFQLKEMVVDEQGLCSKSSFYRLLEELEQTADVGVIQKGREKQYVAKNSIQK